jgi:hypothetical protein
LHTSSGGNEVMGYVMGFFDGNTTTALWHYAQFFAMSDNSYGTTFGPSTPGVINLISGQTNAVTATKNGTADEVFGGDSSLTVIGDADPILDVCSNSTRNQVTMGTATIGDMLSAAGVTWGSFMGLQSHHHKSQRHDGMQPQFDWRGRNPRRLHPAPTRSSTITLRPLIQSTLGPPRFRKSEMQARRIISTISRTSSLPLRRAICRR